MRRFAAACCAAALVGVLVGGLGGRLAMRLLALADSRTAGLVTDDGFVVDRITAGGTLQLLAAATQIALLSSIVYLVVRPLLPGPAWLRIATVAVGGGTAVGALLVQPDSFDFQAFDPPMLPVALFVAIPLIHVALFAALTERWLAEGSWFRTAPIRSVALSLLVWVLGAFAVVVVAPLALVCLGVVVLTRRHPPSRTAREALSWTGRAVLVGIFLWSAVDLGRDVSVLLG